MNSDRRSFVRATVGRRATAIACLVSLAVAAPARGDPAPPMVDVRSDRIYRVGTLVVVDAIVENRSAHRVEQLEASVELYDFFDGLLAAEHAPVRPAVLGPGHVGTLRVVTPWTDGARKIRYRFTWRRAGEQFQEARTRDIWTAGSASRSR